MAESSAHRQDQTPPPNPMEALSAFLEGDMREVNAQIMTRMESPVPLIAQVASHLIAAGGKRIRPLLTLACANIYGGDMARAHGLAAAVEFIHTATLLHDDVVDESEQRRGQETANRVFGNTTSVLVGDFLFARSFQMMVEDGSLDVLRVLSNTSAVIAQGEVMQIVATNNLTTDIPQYTNIIKAKTAALFAAACQVGPMIAEADHAAVSAMAEYGLNLGIAFQIADDALDYTAELAKMGKSPGDDFREGKMTAPVILALGKADDSERAFWSRTLGDKKFENGDFEKAQSILARHKAVEEALEIAEDYGEKARLALAEAHDHPLRAILHNLVDYSIHRRT